MPKMMAKGERLAEQKENSMKELKDLRISEELVEERKNMIRSSIELPELPE